MRHHGRHSLHLITLGKDSGTTDPKNKPWQVSLSDPASIVMTDFRERTFFKVGEDEQIDEVLMKMKHAGLRAAFVMDKHNDKFIGLITSYDIMGEKPLQYLQSTGFTEHNDIVVSDIMERLGDMVVVEVHDVEKATVQSVLDILQECRRTHLPVVEIVKGEAPHLRGIFSATKVLRLTEEERKIAAKG